MLFSVCLVLLITPSPGRQITANEKRNSTGSDIIKSYDILTTPTLKTLPALAKKNILATPIPIAVESTFTPLTVKQKPVTVNGTKSAKVKKASAASHTHHSPSPKTPAVTVKEKPVLNKTVALRTPTARDAKVTKNQTVAAVTEIATKAAKDKPTASTNQTVSIKSPAIDKSGPTLRTPTARDAKVTKNQTVAAVTEIAAKATKDKPTASTNQTVSLKSTKIDKSGPTLRTPTARDAKVTKNQTVAAVTEIAAKAAKDKPTASTNQTVPIKSPAIDKSGPTLSPISAAKPAGKDRPTTSVHQANKQTKPLTLSDTPTTTNAILTKAVKTPGVPAGAMKEAEKPVSAQQTKAVTGERCNSSYATEQEVELKPGSPLVVTHKISLVPAGCSESCQAEMEAVKARLEQLEKEVAALKEQKGDKGQSKMNVETKQANQDKDSRAEQTMAQKKDQTLKIPVKSQARQETTDVKINIKDALSARRPGQPTVAQALLKHKGKKQEKDNKGRTTVLPAKEIFPKSEAKLIMKDGGMAKEHATSGQLQDQPQTNVTLGVVKVTNGTAKALTILTKVMETSNMLAKKDVTQSSAHTLLKEVKTASADATNVGHTANNTKIVTSKTGSGKAIVSSTTDNKHKQATSANQLTPVKAHSSHVDTVTEKPSVMVAKTILSIVTKTITGTGNTAEKDRHLTASNQTTSVKRLSSDVKPAGTVVKTVTGGTTVAKDMHSPASNQTTSTHLSDTKPVLTVVNSLPSGTMVTKEKLTSAVEPISSVKKHSSGVKTVGSTASKTVKASTSTHSRPTKHTTGAATTIAKDKVATSVTAVNLSVDAKPPRYTAADKLVKKSSSTSATPNARDKPATAANQTEIRGEEKAAKTQTSQSGSGKAKGNQNHQYVVNVTGVQSGGSSARLHQKETIIQTTRETATTTQRTSIRSAGGLGSVKVSNVSSYSFTLTWSAPSGMFKNFTVIRREQKTDTEGMVEQDLDADDQQMASADTTAGQTLRETAGALPSSASATSSRGRAEEQRVSTVVAGNVRSMEFDHLQANTRYLLQIFGTAAGRRSKIHRVSTTTGPEPVTELVFSNVTESSVTVSWSKPKSTFTGYRVTYTHFITGESSFETVESQHSHVVLSKMGAGSSYIITITTTQGKAQSDALTSLITTVPAPPVQFRAVMVTDTRALLQWTPSLADVDRYIISYESPKIPNVTVTVMVSGGAAEHQLRALQRGTLYTVKVRSQKNGLQSQAVSTAFTTASTTRASAVGSRSAVITWKATGVSYQRYRITYHVVGEESKVRHRYRMTSREEVILDHTVTEYRLTRLLPTTHYVVLVQGERDGHYTSIVTTEFVTGKLRFPCPTDCSEELLNGARQSGEVDIYPNGKEGGVHRVYCDMETEGGGWTVFQRRMNGNTDFYRTWSEYSVGFGNLSQEFWLGNALLHNLTRVGSMDLRVELRAENETAYAHYTNFTVGSEENHYSLRLSGYTGTAGDSMRYHNGRPFSTQDKDPDSLGIHCARAYMGGWWYKNCYKTNLNGLYNVNTNNKGVVWIDWKGKDGSLPYTEMKLRPAAFSPSTTQG